MDTKIVSPCVPTSDDFTQGYFNITPRFVQDYVAEAAPFLPDPYAMLENIDSLDRIIDGRGGTLQVRGEFNWELYRHDDPEAAHSIFNKP